MGTLWMFFFLKKMLQITTFPSVAKTEITCLKLVDSHDHHTFKRILYWHSVSRLTFSSARLQLQKTSGHNCLALLNLFSSYTVVRNVPIVVNFVTGISGVREFLNYWSCPFLTLYGKVGNGHWAVRTRDKYV